MDFHGVYTKRWHKGTDEERNIEILKKLEGVPKEKRKVKFVTAIALSNGKNTVCKTAYIEGFVSKNIRGKNGFGFDPIFELENGKTLAELTHDEKNKVSSRRKALERLSHHITEFFEN